MQHCPEMGLNENWTDNERIADKRKNHVSLQNFWQLLPFHPNALAPELRVHDYFLRHNSRHQQQPSLYQPPKKIKNKNILWNPCKRLKWQFSYSLG